MAYNIRLLAIGHLLEVVNMPAHIAIHSLRQNVVRIGESRSQNPGVRISYSMKNQQEKVILINHEVGLAETKYKNLYI